MEMISYLSATNASYFDVAFWALVGGLFSIIGGLLILVNKKIANKAGVFLTPFAAGALLGAAFLELLPEGQELSPGKTVFIWAVVGVVGFFLLEQYLHWFHHHHDHDVKDSKKPTALLVIIGDTIHNAIDGVAIGAAFVVSPGLGIATAVAVAAHEIPQEIGDFGILLKSGMKRSRVLFWNAISSLATLAAAIYTFYLGSQDSLPLGAILGLAAGLFIYIASSDLIPTIHEEAKGKFSKLPALLIILGVVVVGVVTTIAHNQVPHDHDSHQTDSHNEDSSTNIDHEHEEHDHKDSDHIEDDHNR